MLILTVARSCQTRTGVVLAQPVAKSITAQANIGTTCLIMGFLLLAQAISCAQAILSIGVLIVIPLLIGVLILAYSSKRCGLETKGWNNVPHDLEPVHDLFLSKLGYLFSFRFQHESDGIDGHGNVCAGRRLPDI